MTAHPPTLEPQSARDVIVRDVLRFYLHSDQYHVADRILHALATAGLIPSRTLIDATIALVWSQPEQRQILLGQAGADDFEDWPEMDAVMRELDAVAPGWREREP